jgi:hypothetical protein
LSSAALGCVIPTVPEDFSAAVAMGDVAIRIAVVARATLLIIASSLDLASFAPCAEVGNPERPGDLIQVKRTLTPFKN